MTGRGSEVWRLLLAIVLFSGGSVFTFMVLGNDAPAQSQQDLSRIFERQVFANKYSFVPLLIVVVAFSNANAKVVAGLYVKIKESLKNSATLS